MLTVSLLHGTVPWLVSTVGVIALLGLLAAR
ncbi:MAG: hypothetical protein QOD41_3748, partial [Cryptosporangiaceae bacterium]|nr:hypothetical protein [Cryptosporangiaceae bacterium]